MNQLAIGPHMSCMYYLYAVPFVWNVLSDTFSDKTHILIEGSDQILPFLHPSLTNPAITATILIASNSRVLWSLLDYNLYILMPAFPIR